MAKDPANRISNRGNDVERYAQIQKDGKVDDIIIRMDDRMCRCHSYLAINKRNVTGLRLGQVAMKDGTVLSLCRKYYFRAKREIAIYWEGFPADGNKGNI
jgi:hypothetical protein